MKGEREREKRVFLITWSKCSCSSIVKVMKTQPVDRSTKYELKHEKKNPALMVAIRKESHCMQMWIRELSRLNLLTIRTNTNARTREWRRKYRLVKEKETPAAAAAAAAAAAGFLSANSLLISMRMWLFPTNHPSQQLLDCSDILRRQDTSIAAFVLLPPKRYFLCHLFWSTLNAVTFVTLTELVNEWSYHKYYLKIAHKVSKRTRQKIPLCP